MHKFTIFRRTIVLSFLAFVSVSATENRESSSKLSETTSGTPTFWQSSTTLTGNWGGIRKKMEDKGVTLPVSYVVDVLGNPLGGASQGAVYTGSLMLGANIDFEKLLGWEGASFGTQWIWLSGQDLTQRHIQNLFAVDNISGFQTFRLNSLWFQQNFFSDKISLRFGMLAVDTEFENSAVGALFINSVFGWSPFNTNLPNGGPGYPMGAPGIRLSFHPTEWFTYQGAFTQGNVHAQNVNRHGFQWRFNHDLGYLFFQEAIFHLNASERHWGNYRLGSWIFSGQTPAPSNEDMKLRNNYGFYLMGDQMLLPTSHDNKNQGLAAFAHIAFAPPNRNTIQFYVDGGFTYTGPLACRPHDCLGIAVAYGQLSEGSIYNLTGGLGSHHNGECLLEVTYRFQINDWMHIQPDLQYIMQPGGIGNLSNALVVGIRAAISF